MLPQYDMPLFNPSMLCVLTPVLGGSIKEIIGQVSCNNKSDAQFWGIYRKGKTSGHAIKFLKLKKEQQLGIKPSNPTCNLKDENSKNKGKENGSVFQYGNTQGVKVLL